LSPKRPDAGERAAAAAATAAGCSSPVCTDAAALGFGVRSGLCDGDRALASTVATSAAE
jgi:hypothetical protein